MCDYRFFAAEPDDARDVVGLAASSHRFAAFRPFEWASTNAYANFVAVVSDDGFACLPKVIHELTVRPTERFAWVDGCPRSSFAQIGQFAVLSIDVVQLLTKAKSRDLDIDLVFRRLDLAILHDNRRVVSDAQSSENRSDERRANRFCDAFIYTAAVPDARGRGGKWLSRDALDARLAQSHAWRGEIPDAAAVPVLERCAIDEPEGDAVEAVGAWWTEIDLLRHRNDCCATSQDVLLACAAFRGRKLVQGDESNGTVLASFPGSGNTWTRLLLEYATGFLTGSIYDDDELKRPLPAEGNKHAESVLAIKAHILPKQYLPLTKATRVVLLTRHPFNALWAEFQRRTAAFEPTHTSSHVAALRGLGPATMQIFHRFAICMACKWSLYAAGHDAVSKRARIGLLHLRYEDLVADPVAALRSALGFLGRAVDHQRLQCAPRLALDNAVRRTNRLTAVRPRLDRRFERRP